VFSQTISTEEINKRILKDSVSYTWEQANEFVNGLENEVRLDSAYNKLSRENISLSNAYQSLEKRVLNYRDTIVPAYKQIIAEKDLNFKDLNTVNESSEKLLKAQTVKKWLWGIGGTLLGLMAGLLLGI